MKTPEKKIPNKKNHNVKKTLEVGLWPADEESFNYYVVKKKKSH